MHTYTYDYENRLKTVIASPSGEAIYYTYDPFGRRTLKEVNGILQAKYIYDQDNIILDLDSNNNIIAKYIYGPSIDEPLVMITGSGVYYYSRDGLGSIVNLTDNTGQVVESYTYDEYGNVSAPSQVGNRYLYTSREYDPETGLYYYRARYYDPSIGRFLQTDPIGYQGGINLYTYVKNNPVNLRDPYGLWTISIGIEVSAGAGGGGSTSTSITFDDNGNVAITTTNAAGGYGGVGGSSSFQAGWTNADTVSDLQGQSLLAGGSVSVGPGAGVSIGGEYVSAGDIQGANVNIGVGVGVPVEEHALLANTTVLPIVTKSGGDKPNKKI